MVRPGRGGTVDRVLGLPCGDPGLRGERPHANGRTAWQPTGCYHIHSRVPKSAQLAVLTATGVTAATHGRTSVEAALQTISS
ncbi:hypothetical protein NDU88_004456 [Pleurodeles waltl]|uniref:Uncharacterized protein n=1 Tax=Pleurodeles waltl TaxID=8319 RepID=A0AAV7LJY1_PLEWA|nr:hypothetical protein NDU88_004456 [Pleurodeles waltl]